MSSLPSNQRHDGTVRPPGAAASGEGPCGSPAVPGAREARQEAEAPTVPAGSPRCREPGRWGRRLRAPRRLLGARVASHTGWTTDPGMAAPFNALPVLGGGGGGKGCSSQGPLQ